MSHGNVSLLYRPIDEKIVGEAVKHYGKTAQEIADIFSGCNMETLLYVSLIEQYAHAFKGHEIDFQYSALRRDNTGKMQTAEMRLMHDVRVELMMYGEQYEKFQVWLAKNGFILVHRHSCGDSMIRPQYKDEWYEKMRADQTNRTKLDWEGTHQMAPTFYDLQSHCFFPETLKLFYRLIFDQTKIVLENSGYEARLPTLGDFKVA